MTGNSYNKNFGKYLYIGCGHHRLPKFTHVEINLGKNKSGPPDIVADITDKIDLPDNQAELIFSRATMEHLKYSELINCFLENYRLLKENGVVRMVVPDFDIMIQKYLNKVLPPKDYYKEMRTSWHEYERLPLKTHTDFFVAQALYHDHYYLHNFDTLSNALSQCGFVNIRKANPGDTVIKDVSKVLHKAEFGRTEWEVIVEAQKGTKLPKANKIKRPMPQNPILYILAKYLNLSVVKFVKRKPAFPQRNWFIENIMKIYKVINIKKSKG